MSAPAGSDAVDLRFGWRGRPLLARRGGPVAPVDGAAALLGLATLAAPRSTALTRAWAIARAIPALRQTARVLHAARRAGPRGSLLSDLAGGAGMLLVALATTPLREVVTALAPAVDPALTAIAILTPFLVGRGLPSPGLSLSPGLV